MTCLIQPTHQALRVDPHRTLANRHRHVLDPISWSKRHAKFLPAAKREHACSTRRRNSRSRGGRDIGVRRRLCFGRLVLRRAFWIARRKLE